MNTELELQRLHRLAEKQKSETVELLPLLEAADREFAYLNETIVNEIAKICETSQTEVYSIASFYHLLNTTPAGTHVVHLCRTISCDLKGKDKIVRAMEAELGIPMGETTPDRQFTLKYANCMGMCDRGPAMLVDDTLYADLTPSKAVEILHRYQRKG